VRLNVVLDEHFDHPPDAVWAALTDAAALGEWLMPSDFEPEVGRSFSLRPDHETPWEGNVSCRVLELSRPNRMVWSWKTRGMKQPSRLVFELTPHKAGTRLRLRHTGEAEHPLAKGLKEGWPERISLLRRVIALEDAK
jgi:uncharacterized protein YndB with AHSA1/START domain